LPCEVAIPVCTENRLGIFFDYTSYTHVSVSRYPYNDDVKSYDIFGATVCEVEVDLLTGKYQVSSAFVFTTGHACISFNVVLQI
jgi:xanthine dehydrogenase molybdopterin-binding subunit B